MAFLLRCGRTIFTIDDNRVAVNGLVQIPLGFSAAARDTETTTGGLP
jgi:hypothetical protein